MKSNATGATPGIRLLLLLLTMLGAPVSSVADNPLTPGDWVHADWMVGTWSLELDSEPFGVPPGMPLVGLAVFSSDGNYLLQDAGDFGQATFANRRDSTQFGSWRPARRGDVIGTSLFLEADLFTGEIIEWQRVSIRVHRTDDPDTVTGVASISILPCSGIIPTALNCPDPVLSGSDFVAFGPSDIPITFRRLRPDAGHSD